jgi:hypothetical protein
VVGHHGQRQVQPVDEVARRGVTPGDVAPHRGVRVPLVEEVVPALVVQRTCTRGVAGACRNVSRFTTSIRASAFAGKL